MLVSVDVKLTMILPNSGSVVIFPLAVVANNVVLSEPTKGRTVIVNVQLVRFQGVTVVGDTGVTVNGTGTKLRAQWSAATLVKLGTDSWTLIGDIV